MYVSCGHGETLKVIFGKQDYKPRLNMCSELLVHQ